MTMKIQEIRKMAKELKIDSFGKSKMEIVRTIQKTEGNFDCYGRAMAGFCDQGACLWKEDCLTESAGPTAAPAKVKPMPKLPKAPPKTTARKK
jgi:hypothetical protein